MIRSALTLLLVGLTLSGCALKPLYADGNRGVAAQTLSDISVAPIAGRAGWLVRNAIIDRVGDSGSAGRYRLDIVLDDQIEGFGIRSDQSTTRERRQLRARYQLIDLSQQDKIILDATAGSDVGIDVVNSEYATIAAEQTALERLADAIADQIVTRIAINAKKTAPPKP